MCSKSTIIQIFLNIVLNVDNDLFIRLAMRNPIILASRNRNKVAEIQAIFKENIYFELLENFPHLAEPEETGKTFKENALIKASYYFQHLGMPVIADDSGLIVPVLNGEPGILSARYAGEPVSYQRNNEKLLQKMKCFSGSERQAYFICHAVYRDKDVVLTAEGRTDGIITNYARGNNGFGYDPIFLVPLLGKTFAELSAQEKNKISHRYKAIVALRKKLKAYGTKSS
jgi:XTP/dITP diphosphohydrolase